MFSKKSMLNLDNSDSEDETGFGAGNANQLTINKNYAERYDKWRGSEELQKLKDRYGDKIPDEDEQSSSSSSEEEWTPDKEKAFFKTFSLLKKKDPKIYDSTVYFFKNETEGEGTTAAASGAATGTGSGAETVPSTSSKKPKKEKVFSLKDHERKMILEKDGLSSDSDDSDTASAAKTKNNDPSYVQQQANIKKGFSDALKTIESDDEGDDYKKSDLLKPRQKTDKEQKEDDEDYRRWLKGELDKLKSSSATGNISNELQFLRDYWNDPNLNDGEKFLRDYILNRKYQEPDDKSYIPSYDEIVHDSDEAGLSGDEEHVEKMEEFEHKYNFRFEEPDQDFIKRYPRTVETSLRRADEKRKQQRDTAKERKEAEREKKREEIQRLKALKRNEILEKLKQLQGITGDPSLTFADEDVEGDFDPEEHDRRMQKIFNEQYYDEDAADEEKPVFPYDDELDGEEWKAFCPSDEEDESSSDQELGNSEASPEAAEKPSKQKSKKSKSKSNTTTEPDPDEPSSSSSVKKASVIEELIEASRGKRQNNKKKSSIFLQALERSKPKFDSKAHPSFQEYFDEYYKLDFEDLIGDIPCRFKYRTVTPNDFGLTTEEILKVPDRELNQWASVKKTYQFRTPEEEKYDVQAYKQKAANLKQKKKVLPTLFEQHSDEDDEEDDTVTAPPETSSKKKKNKKKKKKKKKSTIQTDEAEEMDQDTIEGGEDTTVDQQEVSEPSELVEQSSKKSKKKRKSSTAVAVEESVPHTKDSSDNISSVSLKETESSEAVEPVEGKSKKKKKKKSKSKPEVSLSTNAVSTPDTGTGSGTATVNGSGTATGTGNGPNHHPRGKKRKFPESSQEQKQKNNHNPSGGSKDGKKWKDNRNVPEASVDDDRLRAYGINPTKYKKQLKYGNKNK